MMQGLNPGKNNGNELNIYRYDASQLSSLQKPLRKLEDPRILFKDRDYRSYWVKISIRVDEVSRCPSLAS